MFLHILVKTVWLFILKKKRAFLKSSLAMFFKACKRNLKIETSSKFVRNWLLGEILLFKRQKARIFNLEAMRVLLRLFCVCVVCLFVLVCLLSFFSSPDKPASYPWMSCWAGECYTLPPWLPLFSKVVHMWNNSDEGKSSAFSILSLMYNSLYRENSHVLFWFVLFCFVFIQFI